MKAFNSFVKHLTLAALVIILISSCGVKPKFIVDDYNKPEKTAILPTINNSADVEGGIVFRNLIFKRFEDGKKKYYILQKELTDSLLNEEGITDGGQLSAVANDEICEILGVDGCFFINIEEMEYQTLGVSSTRKIKANFKLYKGGLLLWEDEREVDHGKSAFGTLFSAVLDPVGTMKESAEDLGGQLALKAVKGWILDHELKPEMDEILDTTFRTIPD